MFDIHTTLVLTVSFKLKHTIDLLKLTAGTYLIKINDENNKLLYSGKVIKQ